MTNKETTRPVSNLLKNKSQTEEKPHSTRPTSNMRPVLKASNESAYSFDSMTVLVCDEHSVKVQKK